MKILLCPAIFVTDDRLIVDRLVAGAGSAQYRLGTGTGVWAGNLSLHSPVTAVYADRSHNPVSAAHFRFDIKHIFCHLLADKIKTTQIKQWASELKASHVFMLDISYLPSRETHYLEVDSDGQLTCFL